MKKAVIYARYSSGSQTEQSIEGQLRVCYKYAKENDFVVVKEYIDRAKTGQNDRRPSFQKMLADSYQRSFDFVIVYSIDRFARDDGDHGADKKLLRQNGVLLLSATQTIGVNADGTENLGGILTEGIYVALAKYYSRELSQKIRRGQNESLQKKNFLGGGIMYGYVVKDKKYCIDENQAKIVREIFELYSKGKSAFAIATILNERKLLNSRGTEFKANGIMTMLKNPRYTGVFNYGGRIFENYLPAIIDKQLFDNVQMKIEQNKRSPARAKAKEEFILTGKLYCGYCKTPMAGESGTSRTGETHYYYKCSTRKNHHSCTKAILRKKELEDLIINATLTHILDIEVIENITTQLLKLQDEQRNASELTILKKQLQQTELYIKNVLTAIKQGIVTDSTKNELQKLEAEKNEIEKRVIQTEYADSLYLTKEQIKQWFEQFADFNFSDTEAKQYLVTYFINCIIAYDDKIIIIFNHEGTNRTELSLDEIELALGSDLEHLSPPIIT